MTFFWIFENVLVKTPPQKSGDSLLEMWWCLTDDGLQRLTQSRGKTSSSLTDDGLDDGGLL